MAIIEGSARRRKALILCWATLVVLALMLACASPGFAGPPASTFGVDYNGPGYSMYTWTMAYNAAGFLGVLYDNSWYSASSYNNNSGYGGFYNMQYVSVWHFAGHAAAGIMAWYKYTDHWYVQTLEAHPYIESSASEGDPNGPYIEGGRFFINKLKGAYLDDLLLVVLLGCDTNKYKSYHYGDQKYSLTKLLRNEKYVSTIIGADATVYTPMNGTWSDAFYYYATQTNRTIDQANASAKADVYAIYWGDYGGTSSLVTTGRGASDKLWPARWGPAGL